MRRRAMKLFSAMLALCWCAPAVAQEYPMPQTEHQQMARDAGVWNAEMTMWTEPGAEPMTQPATETNTMLGPFWLLSEFKCESGEFPFTGHMQLGYDPTEKQYVGTWIDTMNPYLSKMTGSYNAKTQTLTMVSKGRDFMTGQMKSSTMVSKFIDEDTKTFTMYEGAPGDDGKPKEDAWKMMEIKYERRK